MKNNTLQLICCVAIVLAALMGVNTYTVMAQSIVCTVTDNGLRLRETPSTGARVIMRLAEGDLVTAHARVSGTDRTWVRVDFDEQTGWVAAEYLACDLSILPIETPNRPPRVPGYAPPLDQTGPDGRVVFVPNDSEVSIDEVDLFREYLVVKIDPSDRAQERETSVRSVEFEISDDDGNTVYSHTENAAPYCLFGNSTNECDNIWVFEETGYYWPRIDTIPFTRSNWPIDPNMLYRVDIDVEYTDDDSDNWQFKFRIIPPIVPAHQLYYAPLMGYLHGTIAYEAAEARLQMDTLADAEGTPSFRRRMLFYLVINRNLDGNLRVGSVEFKIQDTESGATVYQHTEFSSPYCAFGNTNDESYCNIVWRFANTGFRWPESDENSGVPTNQPLLYNHDYEATMTVTDSDGNFGAEWSFNFEVVP